MVHACGAGASSGSSRLERRLAAMIRTFLLCLDTRGQYRSSVSEIYAKLLRMACKSKCKTPAKKAAPAKKKSK
jgi:hypothetical protein